MTRTQRSFPIAFRLLATACALFVLAASATAAFADDPTKQDVVDAREAKQAAETRLASQRDELASIQARLTEQAFEVDRIEGLVEQTTVDLLATRERMRDNAHRYAGLRRQLNDRAAEAFMDGPGSNLDLVLDAASFSDLSDRLEFVDAVNASDASLAQEVANVGYELGLDEARLAQLKDRQEAHEAAAEEMEAQIQRELQRAEALKAQLAVEAEEYADKYAKTQKAYEELLESISVGSHSNVPMPAGWADVLEACPVATPRAFGDGFGAPRYVGGYHPHRGVDIVAPEGTRVYAPFDGVATNSTNSLGGIAVKVTGKYGSVYNAHLKSIAKLGSVAAGDVIGYVSSTGLAGGTTPHDHFEFWPNVIPANWPASFYGYSQIDGAINPYPLLVAACG